MDLNIWNEWNENKFEMNNPQMVLKIQWLVLKMDLNDHMT